MNEDQNHENPKERTMKQRQFIPLKTFYAILVILKSCLRRLAVMHALMIISWSSVSHSMSCIKDKDLILMITIKANHVRLASGLIPIPATSDVPRVLLTCPSDVPRVPPTIYYASLSSGWFSLSWWTYTMTSLTSLPHWARVGHPSTSSLPKSQDQVSSRSRTKLSKVDSMEWIGIYLKIYCLKATHGARPLM